MLEQFPGRKQMVSFLREQGIEAEVGPPKRYSTDANLAGLSHEAEDLEDLMTPCTIVDPVMCVWPHEAPEERRTVELRFERGDCVAIDGERLDSLAAMQRANELGGQYGLGLRNALENRIIGTKSRGVYEAPGMELLHSGLENILQATLDRNSFKLYKQMPPKLNKSL